jgi:hypothetical protein
MADHLVIKSELDLKLRNEKEAFDVRHLAGEVFKSSGKKVMERVFDDIAGDDRIIRIDRLEIDLGHLPYTGFEETFLDRLTYGLQKKIENFTLGSENSAESTPYEIKKTDREESFIESFVYYLSFGVLPWWSHYQQGAVEEHFSDVPGMINKDKINLFLGILGKERVMERLMSQFSRGFRERLAIAVYNLTEETELLWGKEVDKQNLSKSGQRADDKNTTPAGFIKELLQLFSEAMLPGQLDPEMNEIMRLHWVRLLSIKGFRSIEMLMEPLVVVSGIGGLEFKAFYEKMTSILFSSMDRFPEMIYWINFVTGEKKPGPASKKLLALMERAGVKELLAEQKRHTQSGMSRRNVINILDNEWDTIHGSEDEEFSLKDRELDKDLEEGIYIKNAGLVIMWHFLPAFFTKLGLVDHKKEFIDIHHREKAIVILQYLVDGHNDIFEPLMALNKVLCGWVIEEPFRMRLPITDKDKSEADELLNSVIKHWDALGKTSVDGFRESFIKRDGRLFLRDNGWYLIVERKGLDVLMEKMPWGISLIRLKWMDRPLYVEW